MCPVIPNTKSREVTGIIVVEITDVAFGKEQFDLKQVAFFRKD